HGPAMAAFTRFCNFPTVGKGPSAGVVKFCSSSGEVPYGPTLRAGPSLATLVVPMEGMQLLPISCGICKQLFDKPTIGGKCGHTFCAACLVGFKKQSTPNDCPECEERLYMSQGPVNMVAASIINSLKRRCVNAFTYDCAANAYTPIGSQEGVSSSCSFVGSADEMAAHVPTCDLNVIMCPENCGRVVLQGDLPTHRQTACTVICRRCKASVPSPLKEKHRKDECPGMDVPCHRKEDGCTIVIQRSELASHMAVCPYERHRTELVAMQDKVKECREQIVRQTVKIEALEFELAQKRRAPQGVTEDDPPYKKRKASDGVGRIKAEPTDMDPYSGLPPHHDSTHLGSSQSALLSMFQSFEVAMATRADEVEVAVAKARARLGVLETLTKALAARRKPAAG
ncbi:hypothetical protein KFL_007040010, partial [Klebsormidium nitens]